MSNTAVAVVSNKATLETLMANQSFQESLKTVLPKHLTPERMMKMALVAASRQPLLYKCTQTSILQALMKSAELGLDCSGTLGRAYLVPYFNNKVGAYECQFIAGYQGLIELARRSGHIARIESRVVYDNDVFNVEYGLDQKLVHQPALGADRGNMRCVYAVAELTDGSKQLEVMTMSEIEAIRGRSKAKDAGPWKTDYSEMARKTVIRRITKYLPLSTELAQALEADDEQFSHGVASEVFNGVNNQAAAGVAGVKERLAIVPPSEPVEAPVADVSHMEEEAPTPVENESDAAAIDAEVIDPLESLRANAQAAFTDLPNARRKDLIAGLPTIGEMNEEQLNHLLLRMQD